MRNGLAIALLLCTVLSAHITFAQPWNTQIVDNEGDAGQNPRIVTTSAGTPYILYGVAGPQYDVRLSWWVADTDSTGGWNFFKVSDSPNSYVGPFGMAIDAEDQLHITFAESARQKYGIFDTTAGDWLMPPEAVIDSALWGEASLALYETSGAEMPGIVFRQGLVMRFAVRDTLSSLWALETVESVGSSGTPAIAVDSSGRFHVLYYQSSGGLRYAYRVGSSWVKQYVDTGNNIGTYNDLVIDDNDVLHVVYYDATTADLKYATVQAP